MHPHGSMRGRGARRLAVAALLGAGLLAAVASNVTTSEDRFETCCSCLARGRNAYGELCIGESTAQCIEKVQQGAPVPSSSMCLREVCADDCGDLTGPVTPRAELEACCACLAEGQDPSGAPCSSETAEACATMLDNGRAVSSTRACFDDVCRGQCDFLSLNSPDAGVADGG